MPFCAPSKLILVFIFSLFLSKRLISVALNQTTNICVIVGRGKSEAHQEIGSLNGENHVDDVFTTKQSMVFIMLKSSSPATTRVFDSLNQSVFQLDHARFLGVKNFYSKKFIQFLDFKSKSKTVFRSNYQEEDRFKPGVYAMRAYIRYLKYPEGEKLLDTNMHNNFSSLTGMIEFQGAFQLVHVIGRSNKEFEFWLWWSDFSNILEFEGHHSLRQLAIIRPKDLMSGTRKGLAMPNNAKKMRTRVPDTTTFDRVTKVEQIASLNMIKYSGFHIKAFEYVETVLEEKHDYTFNFINYTGSYDDLVDQVHNEEFHAVVGDVTILANRSRYVGFKGFTPFVMPTKLETQKVWLFLKPFTVKMWLVTFGIFLYTMFVVWFTDHLVTRGFSVPWKQLGTALWFAFSSIFFSRRNKVQSINDNVMLTSSHTGSLTSMLTVRTLEPTVRDVEWLRKTSALMRCGPESFMDKYITDVLKRDNVKNLSRQDEHPNTSVALLKLPYQNTSSKGYFYQDTFVGPLYKFGDLGFIFPDDSPIPDEVSEAILSLLEEGKIRDTGNECLDTPRTVPFPIRDRNPGSETENLSLASIWEMLIISGLTPTLISLLIFFYRWLSDRIEQRGISFNGSALSLNHNQVQPSEILEPTSQRAQ